MFARAKCFFIHREIQLLYVRQLMMITYELLIMADTLKISLLILKKSSSLKKNLRNKLDQNARAVVVAKGETKDR